MSNKEIKEARELFVEKTKKYLYWGTREKLQQALTHIGQQAEKIEGLEGILSGDPNLTATKEQREIWRASAVKYSHKLESALAKRDEFIKWAVENCAGRCVASSTWRKKAKHILGDDFKKIVRGKE